VITLLDANMKLRSTKWTLGFLLALGASLPGLTLDSPYANGGGQYGGDSPVSEPATPTSNVTNYSSLGNTQSPVTESTGTNLNSSPYTGTANASGSSPATTTGISPKPWEKVGTWIQKQKTPKPNGQGDYDLANQRIQAGKARIKAIKAKEKLDKHTADCNERTSLLTKELEKAEEQAALIENQVKFQENNLEAPSSASPN
jgi:hypothetical protein